MQDPECLRALPEIFKSFEELFHGFEGPQLYAMAVRVAGHGVVKMGGISDEEINAFKEAADRVHKTLSTITHN